MPASLAVSIEAIQAGIAMIMIVGVSAVMFLEICQLNLDHSCQFAF